jgi:flavin-dependent dehydrogenase
MAGCYEQTEPKASMLRTGLMGARMQSGRILAIGETIGTTFPLTGEGVGKAMESAKIAAELIKSAHLSKDSTGLDQFESRVKGELSSKYVGYKLGEAWVRRRWFIEVLCRVASRSPWVCQRIADVVSEKVDLKKALTFRKVCGLVFRSLRKSS